MSITLVAGDNKNLGDILVTPVGTTGGLPPAADITLALNISPKSALPGASITIVATVTNQGNANGVVTVAGTITRDGTLVANIPPKTVELAPGTSQDVTWLLSTVAFSTGIHTVTIDGISDTFELSSPPGAATATISGNCLDNWTRGGVYATITCNGRTTTTSGPVGSWSFEGLPPGTYLITAQAEGYHSASLPPVTVAAGEVKRAGNFSLLPIAPIKPFYGYVIDAVTKVPYNAGSSYRQLNVKLTASTGQILETYTFQDYFYFNAPAGNGVVEIEEVTDNATVAPVRYPKQLFNVYLKESTSTELTFELRK